MQVVGSRHRFGLISPTTLYSCGYSNISRQRICVFKEMKVVTTRMARLDQAVNVAYKRGEGIEA